MSIEKLIFIGGIIYTISKWMDSSSRIMKKMGLTIGDQVTFIKKDGVGIEHVLTGKLVQKNGVPYVLLDSPYNGANLVMWEPTFGKSK